MDGCLQMSDDEYYEQGGGGYEGDEGGYDDGGGQDYYEEDYNEEPQEYEEPEEVDEEEVDEPDEDDVPEEEEEVEGQQEDDEEEKQEEEDQHYQDHNAEEEEDDGPIVMEEANDTNAADETSGGFSEVKGVLDGFGGGSFSDIVGSISSIAGGEGGGMLSNIFSSGGGLESIIANAAHQFLNVNPATGQIIGSILGNVIFNMGGQGNSLTNIGKVVLDNLISGKFRRDIRPFVPPVPRPNGQQSFGLDFHNERDRCLQQHILFEDPEFPATHSSLFYNKDSVDYDIHWLRPAEITKDPQLIVGQKSRFDVKQGALGDCWLLAAAANLTLRDELFYRVVPPDQSFTENYAGIFHFQFWRYGQWTDIVIDDRLPCKDGRLIYMHSANLNEFWSALLEKAYAKLYGSYEHLEGGSIAEALEDFSGGLTESIDLKKMDKTALLAMIVRGIQMGSLFGCSIHAKPDEKEAKLDNGLVCGHAYSITSIHVLKSMGDFVIIRIRNPWGNSKEWNGPWSDGSSEWYQVSDGEKQELGINFEDDGEFWMAFDDFVNNFDEIEICNLSADVMNEISEMTGVDVKTTANLHQWDEKNEDGEWSRQHGTAGGCLNYPETFGRNPQFASYFSVTSNTIEEDGKCTIIIAILQKYRREMRSIGQDSLPIGFAVYNIGHHSMNSPLPTDFFLSNKSAAKTRTFINQREVTLRVRLPEGNYVIVPSTFEPDEEGQFLVRIFANGQVQSTRIQ